MLGVALIGFAVLAPGAGFMAGGGLGFGSTVAGKFSFAALAGNIGIGLTLMGVSEMLFLCLNQKSLVMKKIQEYHLVFLVFKIHQELVLLTQ